MFAAVLDTSVLWPSLQRDFLLTMAAFGLYRPLWSDAILEELETHEQLKLIGRGSTPEQATTRTAHLINQMRTAFADANVTGWEALDGSFGLPDPDDEHVVAAAMIGGAGAIVTHNLRDFPTEKVPSTIEVQDARSFALSTASVNAMATAAAIVEISQRHHHPPERPIDILDALVTVYGMDELDDLVRPFIPTT